MQVQVSRAGANGVKAGCTVQGKHHLSRYSMGRMPLRATLVTIALGSLIVLLPIMTTAVAISGFSTPSTCVKQDFNTAHEVMACSTPSGSRASFSGRGFLFGSQDKRHAFHESVTSSEEKLPGPLPAALHT